jgi:CHASE3 domain sensor protein
MSKLRVLVVMCTIASFIITISLVLQYYQLNRDIEAVAHRAQVAANVEDMLQYMQTLKVNMERHGMTSGYTALIFKQPDNDLSLLYESVNKIIDRLEQIREIPKSETTYQVALDDLRGTIRELEAPSLGFLWVNNWVLFLLYALWLLPLFEFVQS